jgi:hypothetical protein
MIEFNGGVLTAFSNCGARPIHSPAVFAGAKTGRTSAPRVFAGSSRVAAMIAYKGGVLTALRKLWSVQSTDRLRSLEPRRAEARRRAEGVCERLSGQPAPHNVLNHGVAAPINGSATSVADDEPQSFPIRERRHSRSVPWWIAEENGLKFETTVGTVQHGREK